jgi:hypothetical protein
MEINGLTRVGNIAMDRPNKTKRRRRTIEYITLRQTGDIPYITTNITAKVA